MKTPGAIHKFRRDILMEKMKELNVSATINAFVVGPSVTRFEIALAPGVRVGSFTNLQEDFNLIENLIKNLTETDKN